MPPGDHVLDQSALYAVALLCGHPGGSSPSPTHIIHPVVLPQSYKEQDQRSFFCECMVNCLCSRHVWRRTSPQRPGVAALRTRNKEECCARLLHRREKYELSL